MKRVVIGVDLGGTNVRAGAFDETGRAAGPRIEIESRAQEGTDAIIDALASAIHAASVGAEAKPEAIGIAIPGHIDDDAGEVVWAPNFGHQDGQVFRYWTDIPFRRLLAAKVGAPIKMGNDANLAALGEYRFGSGENRAKCLVMLTVGTGIGGGVVMAPSAIQGDARGPLLLLGGNKGGAELGHTNILDGGLDCNAGTYGALEAYCQRDGIVQRAVHKLQRGRDSSMRAMVGGDLAELGTKEISQAAERGDELAIEIYREVGTYLGVGIGNFINIFAPDIVAVGGQIAKAGEFLLGPARHAARDVAIPSLFAHAEIQVAEQLDDAGLLGAAALAFM